MKLPLQISARNLLLPPEADAAIRQEVAKLDEFYDRVMACRVLVEMPHRHATGENAHYNLRIDLTLPGGELAVTRQPQPDLFTAIQDAFDAARRQIQDYARRQRGDVKVREEPGHARVSKLFPFEGYGFLDTADGREIYFHEHSVLNGGFKRLEVGTEVRFAEEMGEKGPQASTVVPVGVGRRGG